MRLDLKMAPDQERLHALVSSADVVVVNLKPSSRAALGVAAEQLTALNPRLVYCSITGFGESGPYADRPAFDTIGQAISGLLALLVDPVDGRPASRWPTISQA